MTLESQLNDPDNVPMKSTVQALKLHETSEDLKKLDTHQKNVNVLEICDDERR